MAGGWPRLQVTRDAIRRLGSIPEGNDTLSVLPSHHVAFSGGRLHIWRGALRECTFVRPVKSVRRFNVTLVPGFRISERGDDPQFSRLVAQLVSSVFRQTNAVAAQPGVRHRLDLAGVVYLVDTRLAWR